MNGLMVLFIARNGSRASRSAPIGGISTAIDHVALGFQFCHVIYPRSGFRGPSPFWHPGRSSRSLILTEILITVLKVFGYGHLYSDSSFFWSR
jgi:hypothetical protein